MNNNTNNNNYEDSEEIQFQADQRRRNRIGGVIAVFAVVALVSGYIAATKSKEMGEPSTVVASTLPAESMAAIAPAAGGTTTTETTATTSTTAPAATATTATSTETGSATPTPTVTENPKTYATEDECHGLTGGACRPTSGGWTSVNPAPDKTAVPETMAPPMTTTTPATPAYSSGSGTAE